MSTETSATFNTDARYNGQVKWFNNRAGYGFITMNREDETHDIFVHHSSLSVSNEQYKYLVQGEYVEFNIARITSDNATHEWQATDVTGYNRGFLMCETRYNTRSTRRPHDETNQTHQTTETPRGPPHRQLTHKQRHQVIGDVTTHHTRHYNTTRPPRGDNIPVRFYGQGPRGNGGEQWVLFRSSPEQEQGHYQPRGQGYRRRPHHTQHTSAQ